MSVLLAELATGQGPAEGVMSGNRVPRGLGHNQARGTPNHWPSLVVVLLSANACGTIPLSQGASTLTEGH